MCGYFAGMTNAHAIVGAKVTDVSAAHASDFIDEVVSFK